MYKTADGGCGRLESVWPWGGVGVGGLRPCVHVAARVFVGVQLVVGASAQHQLGTERRSHADILCRVCQWFGWNNVIRKKSSCEHYDCKQPYPALRPVHTEHLVFMGRQVVQRSLAAVAHWKKLYILYIHTNTETQKKRQLSSTARQATALETLVLYFTQTKTGNFCRSGTLLFTQNMSGMRRTPCSAALLDAVL